MVGTSVSRHKTAGVQLANIQQPKITPSAKRRADQATAKKVATAERKAQISEIGKKRTAVEEKKVAFLDIQTRKAHS